MRFDELRDEMTALTAQETPTQGMLDDLVAAFTRLPPRGRRAADLSDQERLAVCLAAGVRAETAMDGTVVTVRTAVPCAVLDREGGGYTVVASPHVG